MLDSIFDSISSNPIPNVGIIFASALGALLASIRVTISRLAPVRGKLTLDVLVSVLVDILAGMFLAFLAGPTSFQLALVAGFTAPFLLTAAVKKGPFQSLDVQELQQTVKKAEKAVENQPEKAQPRWDLSRAQLNLYIAGNLAQVKQIFVITVAVMAAGFAMAAWGVYRAFDGQIQVAILTAASGVITQTIGATFLLIYRLTIRQANDYVGTLERINAVGMAVAIVDQIPDEDGTAKTKARVDLVKQILVTSGRRQLDGKGVM